MIEEPIHVNWLSEAECEHKVIMAFQAKLQHMSIELQLVRPIPWVTQADHMSFRFIYYELCYEKEKDMALKDEPPKSVIPNILLEKNREIASEKKEAEPKQKWCLVVDVSGGESKVRCCKEQYCIGTWDVRSMNQGDWKWSNRRWQEWT